MADQIPTDIQFGDTNNGSSPDTKTAEIPTDINFGAEQLPSNSDGSSDHIGWFHQAVQDISSPFLNLAASSAVGLEGLGWGGAKIADKFGIPGADKFAANRKQDIEDLSNGVNIPYLGTATPWGTAALDKSLTPTQQIEKTTTQIASDGAQIASWFMGAGEAKAGATALGEGATQVVKEGVTQVAKKSFMQGVIGIVKASLPFSIAQGLGAGLGQFSQNVGKEDQGKNVENSAVTTGLSVAGNMAGYIFMSGATGLLKSFGTQLIKSQTVQAANSYLVDTISKLFDVEPKLGATISGEALTHTAGALEHEITQGHKQLVDAIASTLDTKANPDDLWGKIKDKFTPWVDSLFKARDESYSQLGIQNPIVKGGFPKTMEAIQKAKTYLESVYGQDYRGMGKSALSQYVGWIENTIGDKGENGIPRNVIESLHDKGDILTSGNPKEQAMINSIQKLLHDDSLTSLRSDPITKPMADLWDTARGQASEIKGFLSKGIGKSLKSASEVGPFIDSLFSGKAPSIEKAQQIIDGFGGQGSDTLNSFSELIRNRLLQVARYANSDYSKGGKIIEDFLGKWDSSGILNPTDKAALKDFSSLMQNGYSNIVDGVKSMMEKGNPETKIAEDLTFKATDLATKGSQLEQVTALRKGLGDKPFFTTNTDGTFNMKNAVDALTKANTSGQYDGVIADLSKLNPEKITSSKFKTVSKGLLKMGLGGTLISGIIPGLGSHGYIGTGMIVSGFYNLMNVTKDQAEKLTDKDIATWVSKLADKTDAKGESYITPSMLTDFVTGKYDSFFNQAKKIPAEVLGKGVASITQGTQNSYSFDQYLKAAESLTGLPLSPEQKQQLQEQYDTNVGQ